jgi:hypothetical protein
MDIRIDDCRELWEYYSIPNIMLICVISRRMPRISSVSFVNEHVNVLTSSSSFDCSILKTAHSRSISSIFHFKLILPDIIPC